MCLDAFTVTILYVLTCKHYPFLQHGSVTSQSQPEAPSGCIADACGIHLCASVENLADVL